MQRRFTPLRMFEEVTEKLLSEIEEKINNNPLLLAQKNEGNINFYLMCSFGFKINNIEHFASLVPVLMIKDGIRSELRNKIRYQLRKQKFKYHFDKETEIGFYFPLLIEMF